MTKSLEDRVAELERYRITAHAEINLLRESNVIFFMQFLAKSSDKNGVLQNIRENLLNSDASESEAYVDAVEKLITHLKSVMKVNELRKN